MGLFRKTKEPKQVVNVEDEVKERVGRMADPTKITTENLSLQVLVLNDQINKNYSNLIFTDVFDNMKTGAEVSQKIRGIKSIYEEAIEEGLDKWLDPEYLEGQRYRLKEVLRECSVELREYVIGQLEAVTALQEGELYYCWTDPNAPIKVNPALKRKEGDYGDQKR